MRNPVEVLDLIRAAFTTYPTIADDTLGVELEPERRVFYERDLDAVTILARPLSDGQRVVLSDAGEVMSRREMFGEADLHPNAQALWDDLMEEHHLSDLGGQIWTPVPIEGFVESVYAFAEAISHLDEVSELARAARILQAPFTPEQVENLNRSQHSGRMHPFTCPGEHAGQRDLVAEEDGWHCTEHPDYLQAWAWRFQASGELNEPMRLHLGRQRDA